ncbi:prepilin-type N-terminal cleavage/methylation domain-containing protein [uncultured Paraglaciecola sp.]|uniref:prepilin-type N-terminal cleavage/methylation domain-containing protein n=1 Tax=uncultured Paraglaciecola sp. TaxID=1765024 RepID=UPI002637AD9C|nr:prepilin-type N-terminal cleavage/methylation domain-containing protein [uncultured Paraglaciecola sp.]
MKSTPRQQYPYNQQGVGMIEVLVTLFILSVGLLGVAYLQFVGSFTNSEALSRSQSVLVAQQLTERLRSSAVFSPLGKGLVVHNDYFDEDLYNFANMSCASGLPHACYCIERPVAIPDCNTLTCTAAQLAVFDAYEVSCSAVAANPELKINLSCEEDKNVADTDSCSVGSKHIVILSWPVESWQGIERTLNADCNVDETLPHDCVSVDVTL